MSVPAFREQSAPRAALSPPPRPPSSTFHIPIDLGPPPELLGTAAAWAGEGRTRRVIEDIVARRPQMIGPPAFLSRVLAESQHPTQRTR